MRRTIAFLLLIAIPTSLIAWGEKGHLMINRLAIDATASNIENSGRLVNAFRFWRKATTPGDREAARANAVFYAGVLGHYVADTPQPMHMSIHYNGWDAAAPNPKNYTKARRLHSRYESGYVDATIEIAAVRPKVRPPPRLPDVWTAIKDHLSLGFADLEPMYSQIPFEILPPQPSKTALAEAFAPDNP
jgi:hypothetical protein